MPELPEVETTLRGIKPHIIDQKITDVIIRHYQLRWPIPADIRERLRDQVVKKIYRRAKYILFEMDNGTFILHLGMSGRVRILSEPVAAGKHDHVDIYFSNQKYLRFTDPRRFGALLWTSENAGKHPLLIKIGPEPLSSDFDGQYLWEQARRRKVPVKSFIMNSHVVAGVGNIYAVEALFQAKIKPQKPAGKISLAQYQDLAAAIKIILKNAIEKGGTTLKDFMKSDGTPGYFSIQLQVYGRGGKPCVNCGTKLKATRMGQRSTVYCSVCQK